MTLAPAEQPGQDLVERGLTLLRSGDVDGALQVLRGVVLASPYAAAHAALGMALLASGNPREALACIEAARALGDRSPPTLVNLGVALAGVGRTEDAISALDEAADAAPGWAEPAFRKGEISRALGDADGAWLAYQAALFRDPGHTQAIAALIGLSLAAGNIEAAIEAAMRATKAAPSAPGPWAALGQAQAALGDHAAAATAFATAMERDPDSEELVLSWGQALVLGLGVAEAYARVASMIAQDPGRAALHLVQGRILETMGDLKGALECHEAALAFNPESRGAVAARAIALFTLREDREAEAALRDAMTLLPDAAELATALGGLLFRTHRHAEARRVLEAAVGRFPSAPGPRAQLGTVLTSLGLQHEGLEALEEATALSPSDAAIRRAMVSAVPYHPEVTAVSALACSRAAAALLPPEQPLAPRVRPGKEKLRIGFMSGSFRVHPVSWLTVAGVEALDRDAFEVVCYSTTHAAGDWMTDRWVSRAASWVDAQPLDDETLTAAIRMDDIDILVDLGGWGDGGRPGVFARRAAPVQAKWVGAQSHSSGIAAMDWFITDRWESPPGSEAGFSERLMRLRDGYVCYSPPTYAPDVRPSPALRNGFLTFGCFNNLAKVTPDVVRTWAAILHAVPASRLRLKTHQFSEPENLKRIREAFAASGIPAERIDMRGRSSHPDFLAEYGEIDIALDPFPYSGGLTTVEALWMGVPTLAMAGDTFAGRHSASHMCNAGLEEWVRSDGDGYIAFAVSFREADARARLADLRGRLREQVRRSPLCDASRFGQALGMALTTMWQTGREEQGGR